MSHEWEEDEITEDLSWCKHCGALRAKFHNNIKTWYDYKAPIFTLNSPNFSGWSENYPVCALPGNIHRP